MLGGPLRLGLMVPQMPGAGKYDGGWAYLAMFDSSSQGKRLKYKCIS